MKSRRTNVSEDGLTISRRDSQSSTSMNGRENSLPIPIDLKIQIFSTLPAKCIARCRCVSKLWASILRRPDFTEFYLTKSSARPQLLFACQKRSELFFFSTPQPQNPDESSSPLAASYHMKIPFNFSFERFSPINGLLCLSEQRILEGRKNPLWVSVICNPTTGQSSILPKMKTMILPKMKTMRRFGVKSFFGYDPIGKHFKVLSMTFPYGMYNGNCDEYQVLTLGAGKMSWRLIECCMPHCPVYHQICINGVLYYLACVNDSSKVIIVVCFDFSSEKFRFMKFVENFSCAVRSATTLIDYHGKLGSLMSGGYGNIGRASTSFELWVLEDPEKQEWSKHVYVLPPLWKNVVGMDKLIFVGMIGTNEIVLSPLYLCDHSYVFYYNIERNTVVRVEIQGMELFERSRLHTFLNHVENVKLLPLF